MEEKKEGRLSLEEKHKKMTLGVKSFRSLLAFALVLFVLTALIALIGCLTNQIGFFTIVAVSMAATFLIVSTICACFAVIMVHLLRLEISIKEIKNGNE